MATKPKCSSEGCERDSFSKGLCSRCYGIQWRAAKKAEAAKPVELPAPAETAIAIREPEIVAEPVELPTVHLVARNPEEMQAAQADMLAWLKQKLTTVEVEVREMNAALNEARTNGWKTDALQRARNRAISLETFYFKLLMAVEAGYTVIPEFPVDVFAIRVQRGNVTAPTREERGGWGWPTIPNEQSDRPPAGAGEYKNPSQLVRHKEWKGKEGDKDVVKRWTTASDWQDEIVFPMTAARPLVMNETAKAMALKVFDQVGICRPVDQGRIVSYGKGDPLIIGQILHQRASGIKAVSFIIAWYLNLNEL